MLWNGRRQCRVISRRTCREQREYADFEVEISPAIAE
jgi:hypothetical protein